MQLTVGSIQCNAIGSLTLWGPHILQSSLCSPTCSCIYELPDPEGDIHCMTTELGFSVTSNWKL